MENLNKKVLELLEEGCLALAIKLIKDPVEKGILLAQFAESKALLFKPAQIAADREFHLKTVGAIARAAILQIAKENPPSGPDKPKRPTPAKKK